jgi:hypothetical protein
MRGPSVPLRDHLEALISAHDRRYQDRYEEQKEAIARADTQRQRDHDAQNQWRDQFGDMERTLMPRRESQATTGAISEKISELSESDSSRTGAGHRGELTTLYVLSTLGPLVAVAALLVSLLH